MDKLQQTQEYWNSRKLYRVLQNDAASLFTFIIFTFFAQYKSTVIHSIMTVFIKCMIQSFYAFLDEIG